MLSECAENESFLKAVNAKGVQFSAESLFMALIFQQQKMISQLIANLSSLDYKIHLIFRVNIFINRMNLK